MITVTQMPGIAQPSVVAHLDTTLRTGSRKAGEALQTALAAASPGQSGTSWQVQRLDDVGVLGWGVVSVHPGIYHLNRSAHWPGKMPPWSSGPLAAWARSHGLNPFLVARALQRRGGFHAGFGGKYESFVELTLDRMQGAIREFVHRDGIVAFLQQVVR